MIYLVLSIYDDNESIVSNTPKHRDSFQSQFFSQHTRNAWWNCERFIENCLPYIWCIWTSIHIIWKFLCDTASVWAHKKSFTYKLLCHPPFYQMCNAYGIAFFRCIHRLDTIWCVLFSWHLAVIVMIIFEEEEEKRIKTIAFISKTEASIWMISFLCAQSPDTHKALSINVILSSHLIGFSQVEITIMAFLPSPFYANFSSYKFFIQATPYAKLSASEFSYRIG